MVTIKDIAKKAGVAQGTVSNVLNNKGNVSSTKIKQVLDAAASLGYVPNERAKSLRKGESNLLAAILPNLRSKQYIDFYLGFKSFAESSHYTTTLYLTNNNQEESEIQSITAISSSLASGVATISSCTPAVSDIYEKSTTTANPVVVFAERHPNFPCHFVGFDYYQAGASLALKMHKKNYQSVYFLTGSLSFSNEFDCYQGFLNTLGTHTCNVSHIITDKDRIHQTLAQRLGTCLPEAIVLSDYSFAEPVKDMLSTFYPGHDIPIYTVSPLFVMPEKDFSKYELNYHNLGKEAAAMLIKVLQNPDTPTKSILPSEGFRNWHLNLYPSETKKILRILTLNTPTAYSMKQLASLYTQKTGIEVAITIAAYDEIYQLFNELDASSPYDILRLDVTWLSWYAKKILTPLEQIDPTIVNNLSSFLNGTLDKYAFVDNILYALPSTPSIQLLFYRKDLFESSIYQRMYYEQYKQPLVPPTTFEAFNQIARFFTKSYNPHSPTDFGATLTLGSTGVAGTEFLARLLSLQDHLYDSSGSIILNSPNAIQALKLLVELKHYSSPNYSAWWSETAHIFSEGSFAMSFLYSNYASDLLKDSSKIIGNIGYSTVPGANALVGGGTLGISKYAKHPQEALHFIQWLCSEPIASAATLLGGVSPCKKTYENYDLISHFPWLDTAKNCFAVTKGRRVPPTIHEPFNERSFLEIVGTAVKQAYYGECSIEDALAHAQMQYQQHFICNLKK